MKKTLIFWFTGLSGSGKSTIVKEAARLLLKRDKKIKIYDGDTVRKKVNKHLTFIPEHIRENNKIIAELCNKAVDVNKYDYIFVSVITPFEETRKEIRRIIGNSLYFIYCKASIETVIKRDAKGLYRKALSGEIDNFIGIDEKVPYQSPKDADLVLDTDKETLEICINKLISFINLKER